jgi:hypothetical protein
MSHISTLCAHLFSFMCDTFRLLSGRRLLSLLLPLCEMITHSTQAIIDGADCR